MEFAPQINHDSELYLSRQVFASSIFGMRLPITSSLALSSPRIRAPFEEVKYFLKKGLEKGTWRPGEKMPSEPDLIGLFGVARMTVNRALKELQAEGLIERRQGAGTFAAQLHRVSSSLTIRDIHEEILARGHTHRARVHLACEEKASTEVASALSIAKDSRVFHTIIVHYENAVPIQCEDRYVNPKVAPNYLQVDFESMTPTKYLFDVAPLWKADYAVEAALPSTRDAKWLAVKRDTPCLVITRRTMNRQHAITWARLVHPADRYRLEGAFTP
jgi:GntR family transcriptional regulator, histidine utilization repressor